MQDIIDILQDDLSVFALPLYLGAILLEAAYSSRNALGYYRFRDTLTSLSMLLASALVEFLPRLLALWLIIQLHDISPLLGFDAAMIITMIGLNLFYSEERADDPVRYGLTRNLDSHNPWTVLSYEYRAIARDVRGAGSWRERCACVFGPPGWRPATEAERQVVTD